MRGAGWPLQHLRCHLEARPACLHSQAQHGTLQARSLCLSGALPAAYLRLPGVNGCCDLHEDMCCIPLLCK